MRLPDVSFLPVTAPQPPGAIIVIASGYGVRRPSPASPPPTPSPIKGEGGFVVAHPPRSPSPLVGRGREGGCDRRGAP